MTNYISLREAASYLGVSKNTLRNWDQSGKLKAERNPSNGYRRYDLNVLRGLRGDCSGCDEKAGCDAVSLEGKREQVGTNASRDFRSLVNHLHTIIRDSDASSDLMERFDEISKLLFVRLCGADEVCSQYGYVSSPALLANGLRELYEQLVSERGINCYGRFGSLLLDDRCMTSCYELLLRSGVTSKSDVKGAAYEEVIRGTFDKSDNQQYFTPPLIVEFMTAMLEDEIGGVVCDPACGTSGFLISASKRNKDAKFLGIEVDSRLAWVSELNLCLHEIRDGRVELLGEGGALGSGGKRFHSSVDVILTNPPFGSDYTDVALLSEFELGKGRKSRRRGTLFIEQCWNFLKDGGIAAIVIDQGILTTSSSKDVRSYISSHFDLLAVVDLPDTAFMPYATVSTSILILRKHESGMVSPGNATFFAKARNVGRKPNGDDDFVYDEAGNQHINSDLEGILRAWRDYVYKGITPVSGDMYVCKALDGPFANQDLRLDFAFHHPMRLKSVMGMEKSAFPLAELGEICCERNQVYIPSADPDATTIMMTGLANIEAKNGRARQMRVAAASVKSGVKRYEMGDVIFAKMRPSLRKVAYMGFEDGGYASNECAVFIVRRNDDGSYVIDPRLLSAVLRSDFVYGQIVHLVQGSGRPRLSNKNLRQIKIPIIPASLQSKYVAQIAAQDEDARRLRASAANLLQEASALESAMVNECVSNILEGAE